LNIGIDGFSDKSLRFLRKPYNWARVQKAIAAINQLKIQHFGYVIFTFPSMTRRDLLEIVNNLLTLCLNFEHFNPIFANAFPTAFDGSKLMEQVDETGVGVLSDPEVLGYSKRLPTDIRPQDRYVNDIFYQEITEDEIRRVTKGLGWWVVEKLLEERAGFLERADDSSVFSLSDIFIHHRGLLKRDYSIALLIFMQKKMLQNFGAYEQ